MLVVVATNLFFIKTKVTLFCSRQLKVAEMDGRAGAKKREAAWKRSAGAVDDQKWSKIARPKKTQISPPSKRKGALTGTKTGSLTVQWLCIEKLFRQRTRA